jgi:hypothetical protein
VDEAAMRAWCTTRLGSSPATVLFTHQHLSSVWGLRLEDGREVVVKARPAHPRLLACAQVHQILHAQGFPCPGPLTGPAKVDTLMFSAESLVPAGEKLPGRPGDYASLLARLIHLAPAPTAVAPLAPNPPWTDWDHTFPGLWPPADDRDDDLNSSPSWLDEVAREIREHLSTLDAPPVIGHGDFIAQNVAWLDGQPLAVHDWDSVISAPEAIIAGLTASVWQAGAKEPYWSTIAETGEFLELYQHHRGSAFSPAETRAAWLAGLWVLAFNAKKASFSGIDLLTQTDAAHRLSLGSPS